MLVPARLPEEVAHGRFTQLLPDDVTAAQVRPCPGCCSPAEDGDQRADEFWETERMVRIDDATWFVVDGPRWPPADPAIPADALDDSRSQDRKR